MNDLTVTPRESTPFEEIVDQILNTGKSVKSQIESGEITQKAGAMLETGEDRLADLFKVGDDAASRDAFRKKARIGAGVGALALLLGSRGRRKRSALPGLAALGALAFTAYKANGDKMPTSKDEVIGLLRGRPADDRSQVLLSAMVSAAQVDGVLSDRERDMIMREAGDGRDALEAMLAQTPDAARVAAMADSPQAAREIYAVSARIADGLNADERAYLDRLAMALDLDPETAARIETDVRV